MKLTRHASAIRFLETARAALEEQEAVNGLIVGIAARVAEQPDFYSKHPIYFATVADDGRLIAAAVRTPPHRVIIYSALGADPAPLRLLVDDLLEVGAACPEDSPVRRVSGVTGPSATALAFAEAWSERTGRAFAPGMSLRIYELTEVHAPAGVPGHLRPAGDDELDLLAEWVYQFNVDCHLPLLSPEEARDLAARYLASGSLFLWDIDGRAVSLAGRGRNSSHGITVNLVYTPAALRGHGYASACVAALSQQLLDAGWAFTTLYTDLANPISNSIYQRIGYRPVCDSNEYDFSF